MRSAIFMLAGLLLIGLISISQCYHRDTEDNDEMDLNKRDFRPFARREQPRDYAGLIKRLSFGKRKQKELLSLTRGGHGERRQRMHDFIHKQLENSPDKFAEIRGNGPTSEKIFSYYQTTFGRNYKNKEETERRRASFKKRLLQVMETNENPKLTHKASINAFSDLTDEEFNAQKKGLKIEPTMKLTRRLKNDDDDDDNDDDIFSPSSRQQRRRYFVSDLFNNYMGARSSNRKAARFHRLLQARQTSPSLDWVSQGRVTSVKDQMQCGDCYAFATMAVLEGLWASTTGNLVDFSPQELTDCSIAYGNSGCDGGYFTYSIDYLNNNGDSVSSWTDYNYMNAVGTCRMPTVGTPYSLGNIAYQQIPAGDEGQLLNALINNPVWIGFNANTSLFNDYQSGIINMSPSDCDPNNIDHAVTLVGYGNDPVTGLDYWKIKNSWGTEWGEDGFVRIARGTNVCGLASFAFALILS